jgi:hypothetical protein
MEGLELPYCEIQRDLELEVPEAGGRIIGVLCELPTDIRLINMLTCESVLHPTSTAAGNRFQLRFQPVIILQRPLKTEMMQSNP